MVKHHYSMSVKVENKDLVEYWIEHGAVKNQESRDSESSLFGTCESGNKELVKYFVEHGADINKKVNGEIALFKACESGNK